MGVLCLLLDKKRQYSSLLADIFNITGHKLLIALDEEKALELLKMASPEAVLLSLEDLAFWLKILEMGYYPSPIFFLESHEDAEIIRKYGLREVNYVVLPFNPIELLTRVVNLSKSPQEPAHLETIGPTSTLLKLLRHGITSSMVMEGPNYSCAIYIENGVLKGSNCNVEELVKLMPENLKIWLEPYREEDLEPTLVFANNWEFFGQLVSDYKPETVMPQVMQEEALIATMESPTAASVPDLDQPLELGDGFYWVGVQDKKGLFHKNAYLRIYGKDNIKVPILINMGTEQEYVLIRTKLEQVLGPVDVVKGIILMGSGIDESSGILGFLQGNKKAFVITSINIAQRLKALGIPQARIRTIETFPRSRLKLASGHVLRFIPTPFLPEAGSFAVLEEDTGRLFTGRLLSSLVTPEEFNPLKNAHVEDMLLYTNLIAPSQEALKVFLKRIEHDTVLSLYPMLGNPLNSEAETKWLLARLEGLTVVYRDIQSFDTYLILETCENLLKFLEANLESPELNSFLEDLYQFAYIEDSKIIQVSVDIEALPSIIVGIMYSNNLNAKFIKEAIRHFYLSGAPFTI
ncbi:MAG: hypothetical protein NZ851_02105 [Aquificaceae bacterium]|nr:hypothetical protein [Aquificaceae bacterium]